MTQLEQQFERKLRAAAIESFDLDAFGEWVAERVRTRMYRYGRRHGYNLSNLIAAVRHDAISDTRIRIEIPHPGYLFETGTVDHRIPPSGTTTLSFVWEDRHNPPDWVREEFEREGNGWRVFLPKVEVTGLPEGRFIRDTRNEVERMFP